ncbi:hypothetical protein GCK72_008720 [Caenorhabditis remanei]|uniref:Uncharacterized protein n=1 Tax=Caenorhabditis remanei TaxID=31234 RepID=A0A6A5H0D7_CAERE|nr:hypothetical protein GCK72_008720 [Caenorhabditis remanei]KAF1760471.1 hypothetical protein GCK72_008720 [Caenorhabditis remanei]
MSSTNSKKRGRRGKREEMPMFVPGCTRCHKLHMSMWCPEPLMAIDVPKPVQMKAGNDRKEEMSSTTISNNRSTTWKEAKTFGSDNNNSAHMKNRNGSVMEEDPRFDRRRRGRGPAFRSAPQRFAPPQSSQTIQKPLMRNVTSSHQSRSSPSKNVEPSERRSQAPNSTRRDERPVRSRPAQSYHLPKQPITRLPKAEMMISLNNELRPFSYGDENMYQEVPMAKQIPKTIPRVPENQMYVFRKRTYYDEHGNQVDERETATIVHLDGDELIFVDLNDDFEF